MHEPLVLGPDGLAIGYAAAAVLLLLYFACERGACHRSHRAESCYLSVLVLFVHAASIVWGEVQDDLKQYRSVYRLRQLMRLVLVLHILVFFVFPVARPQFFREDTARRPAQRWAPHPSRSAKAKAQELEDLINDAVYVSQSGALFGVVAGRALAPVLLAFVMAEDICWVYQGAMQHLETPLLVLVVALHVVAFLQAASKFRRFAVLGNSLHEAVEDLVTRRAVDVLEHVLATVSVGTMFEVVQWRTVHLLAHGALQEQLLSIVSKAVLISALQMGSLRGRPDSQLAVRDLLVSCFGEDLMYLKNLIDGSGVYHNLYKLLYRDLTDCRLRSEILGHIKRESDSYRFDLGHAAGIKILSDMDDTLCCSGGKFPAGRDKRFPRRTVYPGFLRLVQALDRSWSHDEPSCNLVFLSARPHLYKDVAEERSFAFFRQLVGSGRMHNSPTLLPGKLRTGLNTMLQFPMLKELAWRGIGDLKFQMFMQFKELYREYDFIFVGDNGQGDLYAGERMIAKTRLPPGSPPPVLCPRAAASEVRCTCRRQATSQRCADAQRRRRSESDAHSELTPLATLLLPPTVQRADTDDSIGPPSLRVLAPLPLPRRAPREGAEASACDDGGAAETVCAGCHMDVITSGVLAGGTWLPGAVEGTAQTVPGGSPSKDSECTLPSFEPYSPGGRPPSADATPELRQPAAARIGAPADDAGEMPSSQLLCVLIHEVQQEKRQLCVAKTSLREQEHFVDDDRIVFFSTYVGAALKLHLQLPDLISTGDLAAIVEQSIEDFDALRWAYEKWDGKWGPAEEALRWDVNAALELLQEQGLLPEAKLRTMQELSGDMGWTRTGTRGGLFRRKLANRRKKNPK